MADSMATVGFDNKTMADLPAIQKLCQGLQSSPKANANNVVLLIQALKDASTEAVIRAALQGLKLFFVGACQDGALSTNESQAAADGDAQGVYRQWVRRQYAAYVATLLGFLTSPRHGASVQVSVTSALMEAVRCEGGVGIFANSLYARLLTTVVTSPTVKPEVFTLLFNKYFQFADVRYYSLWAAKTLALKFAANPASYSQQGAGTASDAADGEAPSTQAAAQANGRKAARTAKKSQPGAGPAADSSAQPAAGAAQGAGQEDADTDRIPLEDVCRNLFDVLCALPSTSAPGAAAAAGAAGAGAGAAGSKKDADDTACLEAKSWCGAAEVGLVSAASDKNESAKARRKRKAEEAVAGGSSGSGAAGGSSTGVEQRALWLSPKAHKRIFSEAWLALLQLPVPEDIYRKVLLHLHEAVIPHMINPNMLADFLTYSLNQGGLVGILALNGIFTLVTRHGLEYPAFYARLYSLLTQDAFAAKHRAQFFALADIFLSSGMVPAYTAASFAKRFARLALRAPPAGAMLAIAFIHNLIRRHPSCMVLLHNPAAPDAAAAASGRGAKQGGKKGGAAKSEVQQGPGADPFLENEQDPAQTRAVESSLWELEALRSHYCPQVAAFVSVLDKDLADRTKTSEVDLSPLLPASYASLFKGEVERRLKQVPIAFYQQAPSKLFDINADEDFVGWAPMEAEAVSA